MYKITYEKAAIILLDYLCCCDADELASMFETTFGCDVEVDISRGQFKCTPNEYYGGIFEEEGVGKE